MRNSGLFRPLSLSFPLSSTEIIKCARQRFAKVLLFSFLRSVRLILPFQLQPLAPCILSASFVAVSASFACSPWPSNDITKNAIALGKLPAVTRAFNIYLIQFLYVKEDLHELRLREIFIINNHSNIFNRKKIHYFRRT